MMTQTLSDDELTEMIVRLQGQLETLGKTFGIDVSLKREYHELKDRLRRSQDLLRSRTKARLAQEREVRRQACDNVLRAVVKAAQLGQELNAPSACSSCSLAGRQRCPSWPPSGNGWAREF